MNTTPGAPTDAQIDTIIFEHSGTGLNKQLWFQRREVEKIVRAVLSLPPAPSAALAAPVASPEPLTAPSEADVIFLDAIQWGRSYGQRHNVTDETLKEVAQGYADKALAALAATAAPTEPTDEAIEDFLTPRMDLQGRVPMLKTIREALSHFAVAAPTESEPEMGPVWYMRDNHTFRALSGEPAKMLAQCLEEFDAGWTSGMLCSKSRNITVHAHGKARREEFAHEAFAALASLPPHPTGGKR